MKVQIRKWLIDIRNSAASINDYLGDNRDFNDYQNSKMLRRAIEGEFEIIGEAMTRILHKEPDIKISNAF